MNQELSQYVTLLNIFMTCVWCSSLTLKKTLTIKLTEYSTNKIVTLDTLVKLAMYELTLC